MKTIKYYLYLTFWITIISNNNLHSQDIQGSPPITVEKDSTAINGRFDLVLNADISNLNGVIRLYIKIGSTDGDSDIFIKSIDVADSTEYTSYPEYKEFMLNGQRLQINFGDYPQGTYFITLRLRDRNNVMYVNSSSIEL